MKTQDAKIDYVGDKKKLNADVARMIICWVIKYCILHVFLIKTMIKMTKVRSSVIKIF